MVAGYRNELTPFLEKVIATNSTSRVQRMVVHVLVNMAMEYWQTLNTEGFMKCKDAILGVVKAHVSLLTVQDLLDGIFARTDQFGKKLRTTHSALTVLSLVAYLEKSGKTVWYTRPL
jgi:hypothetical protein